FFGLTSVFISHGLLNPYAGYHLFQQREVSISRYRGLPRDSKIPPALAAWSLKFSLDYLPTQNGRYHLLHHPAASTSRYITYQHKIEDTTCFSSVESQVLARLLTNTKWKIPPASAAWSLNFSLDYLPTQNGRYHLLQQRGVSTSRYRVLVRCFQREVETPRC